MSEPLTMGRVRAGLRQLRLGSAAPLFIALAWALVATSPAAAQSWQVRLISLRTLPPPITLRSGSIPTGDGLKLNLMVDRGSVLIFTDADKEVRYQVRAEAEPGEIAALSKAFSFRASPTARGVTLNGQLPSHTGFEHVWVSYEIHVPRHYGLVISSKAGDIFTEDIQGRIALQTGGGNIRAGSVMDAGGKEARGEFAANLETGGGNIVVGDVSGSLRAVTAGGHISAGNIGGDAIIRTDGGHIQIGQVRGDEQLSTGGGNIAAARAVDVAAETDGGRIEFGEAAGTIHAKTNGGGIRIGHITAPTELDSQSGSVFVAGIEAPLRASAKDGAITAWFSPQFGGSSVGHTVTASDPQPAAPAAPSELTSGRGDIVVYLPRAMAVNIDALIDQGSEYRIIADPALPLEAQIDDSGSGRTLHVQGAMNGGGSVLHLETGAGNIRLRLLDTGTQEWLAGVQEAMAQQEMLQSAFLQEMQQEVGAMMQGNVMASPAESPARMKGPSSDASASSDISSGTMSDDAIPGGWASIARLFEGMWHGGGIWVNPDEQQKRLLQAVRPVYPEAAREAGLEGDVTLQVEIGPDGAVKDVRPFSGDPELARAAINAVSQWRYAPALLDGRPMSVATTVTLAFRLR